MDTTTVLEIIKMIDVRLKDICTRYESNIGMRDEEFYASSYALTELSNHLQSFIEGQLNAAENQSTEQ